MGMYDAVGNIDESVVGSKGNFNMPIGKHPALISNVEENDENGTVDFKLNFLGTNVSPRARFWLAGDDPIKRKKAHALIAKQLKNVLGTPILNGADMQRAIRALEGKHVVVDVTPRKGSDYQNYWLVEAYTPKRGADVEVGDDGSQDDGLPF